MTIDPAARQLLGDAYVQMDELEKAATAFRSAANSENEIIAPMSLKKAGFVYLELGDKKEAKKVFETIRQKYPTSSEASDIDKYIALTEE
jgi:TolA-binding protein